MCIYILIIIIILFVYINNLHVINECYYLIKFVYIYESFTISIRYLTTYLHYKINIRPLILQCITYISN